LSTNNTEEHRYNKRKRINLFDLFIVSIGVILLIVIVKNNRINTVDKNIKNICFTIKVLALNNDFNISVGDLISDNVSNFDYGKIISIASKPATRITDNNITGEHVLANIPDKIDLDITIKCSADVSKNAITVSEHDIRLGKMMFLKSKGYVISGYLTDIEII
jgi:hypothetical protein